MSIKQSNQGFVRENLAQIEEKLEYGIRIDSIIADFKTQGFEFNRNSFVSALARARKWRESKGITHTPLAVGKTSPLPFNSTAGDDVPLINTRVEDLNQDAAQYIIPKINVFTKRK